MREADGKDCAGAIVHVGENFDELDPIGDGQTFVGNLCVRTDQRGRFRVGGLQRELRKITVWARAADHAATRVEAELPDTGDASVVLQLTRGLDVAGTVVDVEGEPVEGARVSVFQEALEPLRTWRRRARTGHTRER